MKKKMHAIISYIDFEFKLLVYSNYEDKPFLLYEKSIFKKNINKIDGDLEKERLSKKIREVLDDAIKSIGSEITQVNVCYDPENFKFNKKVYNYEFEHPHRITRNDIKRVYSQAYDNAHVENGYITSYFSIYHYVINDERDVRNPVGMDVKKLQVIGEVVLADSKTYYNILNLLQNINVEVNQLIVSNYILKKNVAIEPDTLFIDLGTEKTDFLMNTNKDIQHFSSEVGFRKFSEQLYKELLFEFNNSEAEQAVRFMVQYFVLKEYNIDINVTQNIYLNGLIKKYRKIIINYFEYILRELSKQDVQIKNAVFLINTYESTELIDILNTNLNVNCYEYLPDIHYYESKENYKVRYCIDEILFSDKIMDSE